MKRQMLKVDRIDQIQHGIYALTLTGDCSKISAPGQFVNIKLDGFYLRRPISICKYDAASITLLFKVVGQGTKALAERKPGDLLDVLLPLGNGFDISCCKERPLLVGGGIGVPPLYGLAKALASAGKNPQVVIGFNGADDIILTEEFHALGIEPIVTTADGSVGIKGFVTDAMKALEFDYVYTCGPEPMLKAVYDLAPDGQFSFEARMACGFGACMGCTCETKYGYKRICKDGPVLYKEEIKW
ncbi:dihydroorotate dehydrogenase electron transfer subunit [Ihubacter sp. rT4E-8]|uniref:dihydroorotate dehydrogenase electron transfer subunit n=1 Tax=Ihubacter sp. rT4E-8 TaxID=3242369 RepID=UPI003CEDE0DD